MYLLSDFAEKDVRVKQYVRDGRLVNSYTTRRDEKENKPQSQPKDNVMSGSLGLPLALVGIAGAVAILGLTSNKSVIKAVEEKKVIEKVSAKTTKVLTQATSKVSDEIKELRLLYINDKSSAMTKFYGSIDPQKPQQARVTFAQMTSQKELDINEATKILEGFDKQVSGGVSVGTFKQNVVTKIEANEKKITQELIGLRQKIKVADKAGIDSDPLYDLYEKGVQAKKTNVYNVYGSEFAKLGSGKQQMEQKQYLLLQEYLAGDPKKYQEFKDNLLIGSLLQSQKGSTVGFSMVTQQDAVKSAFEYGYNSNDIASFNIRFGQMKKQFPGVANIYKA